MMTDSEGAGRQVLARMVAARHQARGRSPLPAVPDVPLPTPERAATTAIGRAAQRLYGLPLFPMQVTVGGANLHELGELIPERGLIVVAEGVAETLGVVALCPRLVAALIEMQAMGRLAPHPPAERRPTRTDAAICADFINALLAELGAELSALPGFSGFRGFRYASFVEDARPLALMLDDVGYRSLSVQLRIGTSAAREGHAFVALPLLDAALPAPEPRVALVEPEPLPVTRRPDTAIRDRVRQAPVSLSAILCRRQISLKELRALQPGAYLTLPRDSMGTTRLETGSGQLVAIGKVGEAQGCHALRVLQCANAPADPQPAPATMPDAAPVALPDPPMGDLEQPDPFRPPLALAATG